MESSSPFIRHQLLQALRKEHRRRLENTKQFDWHLHARPKQRIPQGAWHIWLILAGRGFGKTRTGAETIRHLIENKGYRRIALVSDTLIEGRATMIEGVSGLLSVFPAAMMPLYEPSKRRLLWKNGAQAQLFTAENPNQLRGPQFDAAWVDELAKFRDPEALFDQLMMALRLHDPRLIITTTPRPLPLIQRLLSQEGCVVTRGSSYENQENLANTYLSYLRSHYAKGDFGKQEVLGEVLTTTTGALWQPTDWQYIFPEASQHLTPALLQSLQIKECLLAIDPAITGNTGSHETGIILVGRVSTDPHRALVLGDFSLKGPVEAWSQRVADLCERLPLQAVVVEVNQGGDLLQQWLKQSGVKTPILPVRATRSKWLRATQTATYYALGLVSHLQPFRALENRMCTFTAHNAREDSDSLDALVWGLNTLMEKSPRNLSVMTI